MEPYKCDNSRLLAECNQLHLQFLKDREDYEERLCGMKFEFISELHCNLYIILPSVDSERRIRSLQTDKEHLQSHNAQLQSQLDALLSKQLISAATTKRVPLGIARQGRLSICCSI